MLPEIRELVFRPSNRPGLRSPLTVRSTGHYRLRGWTESNRPRGFTQMFWIHQGNLQFQRAGRWFTAGPNEVFHYRAEEPHEIRIPEEGGEYFWFTMDGPALGLWLDQLWSSGSPEKAGPCPVELFAELAGCILSADLESERRSAEIGFRILLRAVNLQGMRENPEPPREELLCRDLENLLEADYTDPDFGIERAAAELGMHRSSLFKLYRRRRNIAPRDYLRRLRLRRGLELLRIPGLPIADVARQAGYRDAGYFSRLVHQATGKSPREIANRGPRDLPKG